MLQERTPRTWAQMAKVQGEEDGQRKGRLQGRIELLEEQLETKFGALDDTIRSRLHQADSGELQRWGTRFVTAESLGEVFES